ncbi:hypothetical protein BOVMAS37_09590 [Streptococcus uberis]
MLTIYNKCSKINAYIIYVGEVEILEKKSDKFIRLAESRTNAVIQKIQLIGNLSNKRNYEYTEKEVGEMFKAIENELLKTKRLFEAELSKETKKFKFKGK